MGRPAARVGDLAGGGHTPPALSPGIGCATVLIGRKPAWRASVDRHICMTPSSPTTVHGPETCYLGSLSVLIKGQMAVREGDVLLGLGPPDRIASGNDTVLIGTAAFGLAEQSSIDEFCRDFCRMMLVWDHLSQEEKEAVMANVVNKQLSKAGVPWTEVGFKNFSKPGTRGELNFPEWKINVSERHYLSSNLTRQQRQRLANTLYHEARHAEQWSKMARSQAGAGRSASQITRGMGVRPTHFAQASAGQPLRPNSSPQAVFGQAMNESVYGSRSAYRDNILNNGSHEQYRNLPEEQDAFEVGDATGGCGGCEGCS